MPYCLSCGKLRATGGGLCRECRDDMAVRKKSEAQSHRAKVMRDLARERRGDENGQP